MDEVARLAERVGVLSATISLAPLEECNPGARDIVRLTTVIVQEFLPTQAFCSSARVPFASQEPFLKFSVPPFPQAPETVPKEANLTAVILAWGPWVLPQPMWALLPSSMIPHWVGGPGGGGGAGPEGTLTGLMLAALREKTAMARAAMRLLLPSGSTKGGASAAADQPSPPLKPGEAQPVGYWRMSICSCGKPPMVVVACPAQAPLLPMGLKTVSALAAVHLGPVEMVVLVPSVWVSTSCSSMRAVSLSSGAWLMCVAWYPCSPSAFAPGTMAEVQSMASTPCVALTRRPGPMPTSSPFTKSLYAPKSLGCEVPPRGRQAP